MGLFDKLKNIFIEEEEIESEESYKSIPKKIEVKEETKKEEVVKEIPQITKEDVVSDRDLIETSQLVVKYSTWRCFCKWINLE